MSETSGLSAVRHLQNIVASDPSTISVSLDKRPIKDWQAVLPLLQQLPNVKIVSLRNTGIASIPAALAQTYPGLSTLDVRDNPGLSSEAFSFLSVLTGFKRLATLYFETLDPQTEDAFIKAMPSLRFFNDIPVTAEPSSSSSAAANAANGARGASSAKKKETRKGYASGTPSKGKPSGDKKASLQLEPPLQNREAALREKWNVWLGETKEERGATAAAKQSGETAAQPAAAGSAVADLVSETMTFLDTLRQAYANQIASLKEQVLSAEHETAELVEAAELLEKETTAFADEKQKWRSQVEREKSQLQEEIGWLRAENERMLHRLRQYELHAASAVPSAGGPHALAVTASRRPASQTAGSFLGARDQFSHPAAAASAASGTAAGTAASGTSGATLHPASMAALVSPDGTRGAIASGHHAGSIGLSVPRTKAFTLRQLHDVIADVYASKEKFDMKCAESQLPRETMEEHLYVYLNTKYGLRNLILENAASILHAVGVYESQDNAVAVFAKILRNEIDEEFRHVQDQLQQTVAELLRVYIRGKHPLKRDDEVNSIVSKKMSGILTEEEWVDVVKYMYNQEDSIAIIMQVQAISSASVGVAAQQQRYEGMMLSPHTPRRGAGSRSGPRSAGKFASDAPASSATSFRVRYVDFVAVLLDFQLRGHERFLQKFTSLFRQCDANRDGLLNRDEFRRLVRYLNVAAQQGEDAFGAELSESYSATERAHVEALLQAADPYGHDRICYSDSVSVLSAELIRLVTTGSGSSDVSSGNSRGGGVQPGSSTFSEGDQNQSSYSSSSNGPGPAAAASTGAPTPAAR